MLGWAVHQRQGGREAADGAACSATAHCTAVHPVHHHCKPADVHSPPPPLTHTHTPLSCRCALASLTSAPSRAGATVGATPPWSAGTPAAQTGPMRLAPPRAAWAAASAPWLGWQAWPASAAWQASGPAGWGSQGMSYGPCNVPANGVRAVRLGNGVGSLCSLWFSSLPLQAWRAWAPLWE